MQQSQAKSATELQASTLPEASSKVEKQPNVSQNQAEAPQDQNNWRYVFDPTTLQELVTKRAGYKEFVAAVQSMKEAQELINTMEAQLKKLDEKASQAGNSKRNSVDLEGKLTSANLEAQSKENLSASNRQTSSRKNSYSAQEKSSERGSGLRSHRSGTDPARAKDELKSEPIN